MSEVKPEDGMSTQPQSQGFLSAFKDKPWEALVGKNKRVVYAHPSVLSRESEVLKTRITGSWSTTSAKVLDWSQFDEATIECAIEFFYARRYAFISPAELIKDQGQVWGPPKHDQASLGRENNCPPYLFAPVPKTEKPLLFQSPLAPNVAFQEASTKPATNLGDEILLHAKVYAFAHEYMCPNLQSYSLEALRACFKNTEKVSVRILPKIFDAFGYIYLIPPPVGFVVNPARQGMTDFVIANHGALAVGARIGKLDDAGCLFMCDIARELSLKLTQVNISLDKEIWNIPPSGMKAKIERSYREDKEARDKAPGSSFGGRY